MGPSDILDLLHQYRALLASVDVGAMGAGSAITLWRIGDAPRHQRSSYVIMSLYCLAAAGAGAFELMRFASGQ